MKKHINALLIFLIALLVYLSIEVAITAKYYINDKRSVAELQNKITTLKNENAALKNELANSSTEAFVEKEAREKLALAKKGETIVYFKWEETKEKEQNNKIKKNFFENIWDSLLKLFKK